MATTLTARNQWEGQSETRKSAHSIWSKLVAFTDSQAKVKTQWFMISLIVQGVFFLPLPAALSFYYGAPGYILFITLGLFFANIISGMGGAGIRVTMGLLATSIMVHLLMLAIYII
ncbi:MAG: hypothetical protein EOP47_02185 [Sphingobacteriaceae bacterium]|nr:MAG: hypothetical protein EOP47_02185 [Sphingobacteriaceae bacterium]